MHATIHLLLLLSIAGQTDASRLRPNSGFEKQQVKLWMRHYSEEASRLEFNSNGQQLTIKKEPVIRWSNPVVGNGSTHGACFVWTRDGRAEVFGTIFSYIPSRNPDKTRRTVAHEFHSLSRQALAATRNGELFWHPDVQGIAPAPIPGAPPPAKTAAARLVQIRRLAREFTATSADGDEERTLRLLTTPLYRNAETPQVLDGALFSFSTGTDPEILLLIEAVTGTSPLWHYSIARFSHLTLRVRYNGQQVWSYVRGGPDSRLRGPKHYYVNIHGVEIRDAIISERAD